MVELARLTIERDWHVRFIELMPLGGGECATLSIKRYVSNIETRRRIEAALGPLIELESSNPSDEARNYTLAGRARRHRLHQPGERALLRHLQPDAPDGRRQVPSVPAQRRRDSTCARPLRSGGGMEAVARILMRAVELKPTGHHLLEGRSTRDRSMYQIGG